MSIEEKSRASGENVLFYVVVTAILVVANLIAVRVFWRADLTRSDQYSLSEASIKAIRGLEDRLVVKAYFTRNLPPPFNTTERYVRDLLEEYQNRSKGKMKVIFIDPSDEAKAEEARTAGITEVTHQVIEKDQAAEKKGFRGLLFSYLGETQKIPVIADTAGLEYEITSIVLLMSQEKRKVGFLQGHGEPKTFSPPQDPNNPQPEEPAPLSNLRQELEQYSIRETNLDGGKTAVPDDIEALVVVGPTEPVAEAELLRIDQFLMKGGNLALFLDGVKVDASMGMLATEPTKAGYEPFLEHFGIRLNPDVVFDPRCDTLPVRGPLGIPLAKRYPGWPLVEIKTEHPTTFRLPVLTFPWVSSLELLDKAAAGDVKATVLARSTPDSWRQTGDIDLDPNQDWQKVYDDAASKQQNILAVAVEGRFRSYFAGKPLPQVEGYEGDLSRDFVEQRKTPGRILVAGSSQMIIDPVVQILQRLHGAQNRAANLAFAMNVVDWLTANQDLVAVRSKGVENPRLNIEKESTRSLLKYGNILGWPLLVIAIGLVRWGLRGRLGGARGGKPAPEPTKAEPVKEPEKEPEKGSEDKEE